MCWLIYKITIFKKWNTFGLDFKILFLRSLHLLEFIFDLQFNNWIFDLNVEDFGGVLDCILNNLYYQLLFMFI